MRSKRTILALSVIVAVEFAIMIGICISDWKAGYKMDVAVRHVGPQTVLYTIYRGHYKDIGKAIDRLYELALEKGMHPFGPILTAYLNNAASVSSEHWLIEIRIPVDASALEFTGTLGDMTDVKNIPAMKVAVAVKPKGQTNPEPVIHSLYSWINQRGYVAVDRMWQSIISNETGDYTKMKTEFMIPISKFPN